MELGGKIRQLRNQKGLTQEELADRCELTKGYISQLENDLNSPSIATLADILSALGSNLSEFFREEAEEKVVFSKEEFSEKDSDGVLWNPSSWNFPKAFPHREISPTRVKNSAMCWKGVSPSRSAINIIYVKRERRFIIPRASRTASSIKAEAKRNSCGFPRRPIFDYTTRKIHCDFFGRITYGKKHDQHHRTR